MLHSRTIIRTAVLCVAGTLFLFGFSAPQDEYTQEASKRYIGKSITALDSDRSKDGTFRYLDITCCCNDTILEIFADRTVEENSRVNPATDYMIASLGEYEKQMKYAVKQVANLEQINAMYSFPNDARVMRSGGTAPDTNYTGEGCEPLDFSNEEDREKYLAVVDRMENSGLGTGAYSLGNYEGGSAFGRYQLMEGTAGDLCGFTTTPSECCSSWRTIPRCQDEIFELLTQRNTQGLMNRGIPLNTCTLYIAHQQGAGGLYWLFGSSNPYDSIDRLRNAVFSNLSPDERERIIASGIDLNNEDNLRQIYNDFWSGRFGENILASGGTEYTPTDFTIKSEEFIEYVEERKHLWREGILLELKEILHNLKQDDKL